MRKTRLRRSTPVIEARRCAAGLPLADGAALVLAVAQTSDRPRTIYTGPLEPDETVDTGNRTLALADQPVVSAALDWLEAGRSAASEADKRD